MEKRREILKERLNTFVANTSDPYVKNKMNESLQEKLINCLLDGTVYSIVESLRDLQRLRENELYEERQTKLQSMQNVPNYEEKMKEVDRRILDQIDDVYRKFFFVTEPMFRS
jgi:hypothetical protein